jgi:hypothetical protein
MEGSNLPCGLMPSFAFEWATEEHDAPGFK